MKKADFIEELKNDLEFFRGCTEREEHLAERYWNEFVHAKDVDEREMAKINYHTARGEQKIYRAKATLVEQYLEMLKK